MCYVNRTFCVLGGVALIIACRCNYKFIPRGLPRDKAMGESGVHLPDEVKNLIK